MGRARRTSSVIPKAIVRLNNLKSISPTLDLGGGLTVAAFEQLIGQAQTTENDHNQMVAALDEKANQLNALLKEVKELSARMLAGVGARHGKNSDEYEKAGGVKTDEIKRSKRGKSGGDDDKS